MCCSAAEGLRLFGPASQCFGSTSSNLKTVSCHGSGTQVVFLLSQGSLTNCAEGRVCCELNETRRGWLGQVVKLCGSQFKAQPMQKSKASVIVCPHCMSF